MKEIGSAGLALIKKFEGCKLEAYLDAAGVQTIGYGHTAGVTAGQKITQAQAELLLKEDCQKFAGYVDALGRNFNDNQRDALISFAFNLGPGNLKKVTVNNRPVEQIAAAMPLYCNAAGEKLDGLVKRRAAEVKLFNTPVASAANVQTAEVKSTVSHAHKAGETVTVSSYYASSTDQIGKAIIKTLTNVTIGKVLDTNANNPYRLDRNGVAVGWCNDGDIRSTGAAQTAAASTATVHTVKSGETLSKIAKQYSTTVSKLTSLNGIADANKIYAGQKIKIS